MRLGINTESESETRTIVKNDNGDDYLVVSNTTIIPETIVLRAESVDDVRETNVWACDADHFKTRPAKQEEIGRRVEQGDIRF